MKANTYNEYLIKLIDKKEIKEDFQNNIKIDMYLTLLSLNNANYNSKMYQEEINITEDFLRRINNLKVKIQLKRKEEEINKLKENIKEIYKNNTNIIDKYNKENIDVMNIIESNNPKELTNLLDKLTKEKIAKVSNSSYYNKIRKEITDKISKINYSMDNDIITINNNIISIDEFYCIFSYLLDIKNYSNIYTDNDKNKQRNELITNIINIINKNEKINDEIIPIVLTHILTKQITNYQNINTHNFIIENIKITDLYSFANNKSNKTNTAKWQKIQIPNEFLYKKIKEGIFHGMYYVKENNFIIENNISSFKTSIDIKNIKEFLKENLKNINNESVDE